MTACINKSILLGFLGGDPVRRDFQQGGFVVTFDLATTDYWKDADGNRQKSTEWHKVSIFNEALGKLAMAYLRKGSAVYIEGKTRSRRYKDRDNIERKVSEVVLEKHRGELLLMDSRQDEAARQEPSPQDRAAGDAPPLDDHVPF
jgi:single-strand DNA-binding protein